MDSSRLGALRTVRFGTVDETPVASVVVVTYETAPAELERTFAALDRQTESAFELFVVDNGTGHDPASLLDDTALSGTWVELAANVGPNVARDFAAERAQGDVLLFLDDDAVPADDFVATHLAAHRSGATAVRGRVRPLTRSVYNRLAANYDLGDEGFPYLLDIEGNTSVDREAYLAAGGLGDLPWGHEGLVLTARLLEHVDREAVRYDPTPVVYHDYACSPTELLEVRFRHARAERALDDQQHAEVLELYREYTLPAQSTLRTRLLDLLVYGLGQTIDRAALFALRLGGTARAAIQRPRPQRDAILMYHSVGERGRYGNVSVDRFREDLSRLVEGYEVVDLGALPTPDGDRPRVAITFDDAYRNFHEHALPVLREFDVPVTLFVPVGLLDGGYPSLAGRLERSPDGDPRVDGPDSDGRPAPLMTSEQVHAALETGLVTLGNHTLTHPDLATAPPESLVTEVCEAGRRLEREFGVTVDRFCYPYGRYSRAALSLVRETHELAVTAVDEPLGAAPDPHRLPRLHAHEEWWTALPGAPETGERTPAGAGSYKTSGREPRTQMRRKSTRSPTPRHGNERR